MRCSERPPSVPSQRNDCSGEDYDFATAHRERDSLASLETPMENFSLSRTLWRVAMPMIGMGVFLLGLAIFAAINVHNQQQLSSELVSREVSGMLTIQDLNQTVREIRYQVNLFLRVDDVEHLRLAVGLNQVANEQLERARSLARTPRELELITSAATGYQSFVRQFEEVAQSILARSEMQGPRVAIDEAERSSLTKLSDDVITNDVLAHLRECLAVNQEVVTRTDAAARETAQHLKIGFILLGICGSVAGLLMGLAIARTLGRSIVQLHVSVRSVAGKLSNLTGPVTFSRTSDLAGIEWDLKTVEQDLVSVIERLHQRESELLRSEQLARAGQLVAGLAHELRNPLMPMKMLVQAALEKGPEHGLRGRSLAVLDEEIGRLEHSIQMFLDYARPPAAEKRVADVREVVHATLELVRGRARQQHVEMHVESPDAPVLLQIDRNQIRQLLLNLLLNALDALPQGGNIRVTINPRAPGPQELADSQNLAAMSLAPSDRMSEHDAMRLATGGLTRRATHWLSLCVADDGPGIPPGMKETLFEPFVTTKETGVGLGLSICQHVAAAHGGALRARNLPDSGAEFTLLLPFLEW